MHGVRGAAPSCPSLSLEWYLSTRVGLRMGATRSRTVCGDQGIEFLPKHFSIFGYIGGDAGSVARKYSRLKSTVMRDPNVRVLPYALSFTSASSTTPQTRPTRCTFTTRYSLSPLLCPWRLHGAIDTSVCERGFSLMNLLKTAKRSRMGNELVPIAHADGRVCSLGKDVGWSDPIYQNPHGCHH